MFISDVELDLEELDYLNSKHYSDSLIEIIKNWNEGDPAHSLTIGLFGCWGTGKSSIVNTVKNNLSKGYRQHFGNFVR